MKKLLPFIFILLCKISYSQWSVLTTDHTNVLMNDITQTPSGKLFAVGTMINGTTYTPLIYKSIDNGISWDTIQVSPNGYFFQTIAFLNDDIGYIGVGGGAYILQTTDGGNTWAYYYQDPSGTTINDIEIIDSANAVACGFASAFYLNGQTYKLTNQINWDTTQFFPTATINDLQMLNQTDGYALSLYDKQLYKTTDGGNSWILRNNFPLNPSNFEKMFWWNVNSGIVVGLNAHYARTTDGGLNWTNDSINGFTNELTGVAFFDVNNGYVSATGGKIFRSTDGGISWNPEPSFTSVDFYNLEIHGGVAYALGANGTIARKGSPSGINSIENKNDIKLFPNPANESIHISTNDLIDQTTVTDITGKILFENKNISSTNFSVSTEQFPDGIYFLNIKSNLKVFTTKLIVIH